MVDYESPNPPQESLQSPHGFDYSRRITETETFSEIAIILTFTINRRSPESFMGKAHPIKDHDEPVLEAESFLEAAQGAWKRYRRSEIARDFVTQKLTSSWTAIGGQEKTGLILELDPEKDEVVKLQENPVNQT